MFIEFLKYLINKHKGGKDADFKATLRVLLVFL
jgi:hypothetical protein